MSYLYSALLKRHMTIYLFAARETRTGRTRMSFEETAYMRQKRLKKEEITHK